MKLSLVKKLKTLSNRPYSLYLINTMSPSFLAEDCYLLNMQTDCKKKFQDKDSCEHLSEKELLQRHIKRAKRVRSR